MRTPLVRVANFPAKLRQARFREQSPTLAELSWTEMRR
jgi:hypothetical protein